MDIGERLVNTSIRLACRTSVLVGQKPTRASNRRQETDLLIVLVGREVKASPALPFRSVVRKRQQKNLLRSLALGQGCA